MTRFWFPRSILATLAVLLMAAGVHAEVPGEALARFAGEHGARAVAGVFGLPGATGRPYSIEVEKTLTDGMVAIEVSVFDIARGGDDLVVVFSEVTADGIAGFYVLKSSENEVARLLAEEARGAWLVVARITTVQRSLPGVSAIPEPPYVARGELVAVAPAP